jgi:hypothetical protein
MSLKQFVNNIPVSSIEESVVKILEKYGLMANAIRFNNDATIDYPNNSWMKEEDDEEDKEMSLDEINDEIDDEEGEEDPEEYDKHKTFTLDEVINTIELFPVKMNMNMGGIWEYSQEHLIDKDKLIEKFKSL